MSTFFRNLIFNHLKVVCRVHKITPFLQKCVYILNFKFSFNASNEFAFYLVPDSRIENDFLSQSISHNAPIGKTVIGV